MAGWITIIGDTPDLHSQINQFQITFNVDKVPKLRTETHTHSKLFTTIAWSWHRSLVPDLYITQSEKGFTLVMCGVITDLGRFGPILNDQESTAARVLDLWAEHRDQLIEELNGSFSCLFYDTKKNETTLFTDRYASRSIWYIRENGVWTIGNFPSAIAAMMKKSPKLNPGGLWSLFHAGRHVGNQGIYADMRCMMAGETVSLLADGQKQVTHWKQRRYIPEKNASVREWGGRIAQGLVNASQRYKKVSPNPYIFLSGGLDSRLAAAAYGTPLKAVTLCNNPNAESRIASYTAKTIGIDHQVIVRSPYWYLDTLDASALISAGIFFTHHTHFTIPVMDIAAKEPDAVFTMGSLLENFNKHYFSTPAAENLVYDPQNSLKILPLCISYLVEDQNRWGVHFRDEIKAHLKKSYQETLQHYAQSLSDVSQDPADSVDTFMRWAEVGIWPAYNMITGIWPLAGERNIIFDNEVYELGLIIPSQYRGAGILHRWTLQQLDKRLPFIPNANTFLPPAFPESLHHLAKKIRPLFGNIRRRAVASRSKNQPVLKTSGSWVLMHQLCRQDARYIEKIEEIINDKDIFPEEIFDNDQIEQTWQDYLAGNVSRSYEIQALLSFGSLHKLIPCDGLDL